MSFFRRLFERSNPPAAVERPCPIRPEPDVPGFFEGTVEHGYAMRSVGSQLPCPRCNAATRQQMALFICATDIAPRVMFAAAGYFCTACPTGHIYFHHGDDSGFKASPVDLDDKPTRKARPTRTRGSR